MGAFQSLHASLWVIPKEVDIKKKTSLGVSPGPRQLPGREVLLAAIFTRGSFASQCSSLPLSFGQPAAIEKPDFLDKEMFSHASLASTKVIRIVSLTLFFYHMGKLTFVGYTVPGVLTCEKIHNTTTTIRIQDSSIILPTPPKIKVLSFIPLQAYLASVPSPWHTRMFSITIVFCLLKNVL